MRFGSVCSGIEAASVAWNPLGWKAAWLSEIEPFPCAVLAHHFPTVPNLGDMTALTKKILSGEVEAPDLLCGGTPCQAFSLAGKKLSLSDSRGNLSIVFCEIADAIDSTRAAAGLAPGIVFWENVPGVLSTRDNAFGCFLGLLAGSDQPAVPPGGRWPSSGVLFGGRRRVAWRVLDAQFFGVPQRRRRVFVIASSRPGLDPAAVLLERKGVSGDPEKSRGEGKDPPAIAERGPRSGVCLASGRETVATLLASAGAKLWLGNQEAFSGDYFVLESLRADAFLIESAHSNGMRSANPLVGYKATDISPTLDTTDPHPSKNQGGLAIVMSEYGNDRTVSSECCPVLRPSSVPIAYYRRAARRLTPVECERLQGFPDNWTRIPYRGRGEEDCPDGPRYKAVGNSWAVPVVRWIGSRIQKHLEGKL